MRMSENKGRLVQCQETRICIVPVTQSRDCRTDKSNLGQGSASGSHEYLGGHEEDETKEGQLN